MALARASLSIVIDAISDGLIALSGLRPSAGEPPMPYTRASVSVFWTGVPSITQSGSLPAPIDEPPRMRIFAPAPGSPLLSVTDNPGA